MDSSDKIPSMNSPGIVNVDDVEIEALNVKQQPGSDATATRLFRLLRDFVLPSISIDPNDPAKSLYKELEEPLFPKATAWITGKSDGRVASSSDESDWSASTDPRVSTFGKTYWNRKLTVQISALVALFVSLLGVIYIIMYDTTQLSTGYPVVLHCINYYWSQPWQVSTQCGLNGDRCKPFDAREPLLSNDGWFPVRCPRGCSSSFNERIFGTDVYTADSRVCASAIHAGAIGPDGGCFNMRFVGNVSSFNASSRNGLESRSYGWFPKAMEFAPLSPDDSQCGSDFSWAIRLYLLAINVFTCVVIRPTPMLAYFFLLMTGFWTAALTEELGEPHEYAFRVNDLSTFEYVFVLAIGYLLWQVSASDTFPDPRRFPFDAALFAVLPFNLSLLVDFLTQLDITFFDNVSFSSNFTVSAALIVVALIGLVLLIPGLIVLHNRLREPEFRGIQLPIYTGVILIVVLAGVAFPRVFSFHFHHYMIGVVLAFLAKGVSRSRYTVVIQYLGLGLFVSGVAVWEPDPFFDVFASQLQLDTPLEHYISLSTASQPVWIGTLSPDSSTELRVLWTIPRMMERMNCTEDILSTTPKLKKTVDDIRSNQYYEQIAAKWEAENEFHFRITLNNVLVHDGLLPPIESFQQLEVGNETSLYFFEFRKSDLLPNVKYVVRVAQVVQGTQGGTSVTFYVETGKNGTITTQVPATNGTIATSLPQLDWCNVVNATAHVKETEVEQWDECYCEGFN